eukprot:6936295-Alexandrium_andersonii.AAC.1
MLSCHGSTGAAGQPASGLQAFGAWSAPEPTGLQAFGTAFIAVRLEAAQTPSTGAGGMRASGLQAFDD